MPRQRSLFDEEPAARFHGGMNRQRRGIECSGDGESLRIKEEDVDCLSTGEVDRSGLPRDRDDRRLEQTERKKIRSINRIGAGVKLQILKLCLKTGG